MRRNGLPQWLTVLLVLVGLVVLGPPALVVLAGLIGLSIGLAAVALKFAFLAFVVFAVVSLFRALFGGSKPRRHGGLPQTLSPLDVAHEEALARDQAEKAALDAELARVMQQHGQTL